MISTFRRSFCIPLCILLFTGGFTEGQAQNIYLGADLSYVNELEDCGAVYTKNDTPEDVYSLFSEYGCNLARFRLWHTPKWYDQLNQGLRYSDLADVMTSIQRAKSESMVVLLDFHLSDTWADPGNQLVPEAWLGVVNNTQILKDSLYTYIYNTLLTLDNNDLLPDMVQIGNEVNKGILLSPSDNQTWTLEWPRNAILFNSAISAVRDIEMVTQKEIKVMIHIAGPSNVDWWINGFIDNGVTDFDMIGISYYWNWHQPTSIPGVGQIVSQLKSRHPDKDIVIAETAASWTSAWNDSANNLFSTNHPDYNPPTPQNQKAWMIDLTEEVLSSGGAGVIYWEPAWVSTPCRTQWAQGSHFENNTFFNFDNNLLIPGGIEWMQHSYSVSSLDNIKGRLNIKTHIEGGRLIVTGLENTFTPVSYALYTLTGQQLLKSFTTNQMDIPVVNMASGIYILGVSINDQYRAFKVFISE